MSPLEYQQMQEQLIAQNEELEKRANEIAHLNEELHVANSNLSEQAKTIAFLTKQQNQDKQEMLSSISKLANNRITSAPVDFDEFIRIYPDRETCFKLLCDLKWPGMHSCSKCGHEHYSRGHLPYSRRCSKCRYEESVLANTIFQNSRIPINKAFYMAFLLYNSKGKISSHKLSEKVKIRQSTCWSYSIRLKAALEFNKRKLKRAGQDGWILLLLDDSLQEAPIGG